MGFFPLRWNMMLPRLSRSTYWDAMLSLACAARFMLICAHHARHKDPVPSRWEPFIIIIIIPNCYFYYYYYYRHT